MTKIITLQVAGPTELPLNVGCDALLHVERLKSCSQ
jgi:hypothetical protein